MNKVYWGERAGKGQIVVTVNGVPLSPVPSQKIRNHSPDGFEWGYSGSGPAQLALAILLHATGSAEVAEHNYQDFKRQFVAGWGDCWRVTGEQVREWLALAQTRAD